MYKKVNNKTKVSIPEYIARPTGVKRSYHSSKFINIGRNSNTCKYNFFTWTLKEWNTSPSFLLDQPSMDAFKSAVTNYFNLLIDFIIILLYYLFIQYYCYYFYYYHDFFAHSEWWETSVNYNI